MMSEQDAEKYLVQEENTVIDERVSKVVLAKADPEEADVVTIVMLPPLSTAESSAAGSKRRYPSSGDAATLGTVEVRASRLRKSSTYFEACMSERWVGSRSDAKTFFLEAQTEVKHYEDCFARMSFLNSPIASVKDGIELLKVASLLGFQAAVDVGVKYLAAAPWSDDDEALVRGFCSSSVLAPRETLCDLETRLADLPPDALGKREKNSLAVAKLLSRLLWVALPPLLQPGSLPPVLLSGSMPPMMPLGMVLSLPADVKKCPEARKRFAIAFRRILWEAKSGAMCDGVVEYATALVATEARRLIEQFVGLSDAPPPDSHTVLLNFSWLFKLARRSEAAQGMAELLACGPRDVAHEGFLTAQRYIHESWDYIPVSVREPWDHIPSYPKLSYRILSRSWAWMVSTVMEDVMGGKLFLSSSQRVELFARWAWFVCEKFLRRDKADLAALLVRFVTTLPQPLQEHCWVSILINHEDGSESRAAYALWVAHMASLDVSRPPPPDLPAGSPPIENEVQPAEEE